MEEKDFKIAHNMKKLTLKQLRDQVIVITGATSGIGLVTARMAANEGARLVLAARNEKALKELVNELRKQGHQATYVKADVGVEADVKKIRDAAVDTFGHFDTWVNNAGISIFGHAIDVTIPDMKKIFDTVYWGVVYGSREAVNHFKNREEPGALINVGSLLGDRGTVIESTYSSAKFAVHGWTESLRMEVEKDRIPVSVTLIHPGRIDTPYNEHAQSYLERQPGHRGMIYPPDVVAEAILYAAEHPKRDMFVGGQAKILSVLGKSFPRTMDKIEEYYLYPTQHISKLSKPKDDSALYKAGYGMHERGTSEGWKRKSSLYVKASKHPLFSSLLLGAITLVIHKSVKKDRLKIRNN